MREVNCKNIEIVFKLHGAKYVAVANFIFDAAEVLEVDVFELYDYESGTQLTRLEPNFLAWAKAEELAQQMALEERQSYFERLA